MMELLKQLAEKLELSEDRIIDLTMEVFATATKEKQPFVANVKPLLEGKASKRRTS